MNKIAFAGLGVLAALSIVAFVLVRGFGSNKPSSTDLNQENSTTSAPVPTVGSSELVVLEEVVVSGDEFSFSPSTINLKKGKTVRLTFKNVGKMAHNLAVPDLGISTAVIAGGKEVTVEVTPKLIGTFESYCSVGNHKTQGMVGKVVVQ
ncbi:MAG: hypothetical protein A2700_01160 [Candidatus Blackburnbacteria bacterium RIFCSPHIGHO2_01_FULL_44_64]|uniref:EfeO-type cupredoxin-like domain-containing protein n=1 Tax=Candidatus Blackburnbacteria bacterium RIFCSPHIGHO2_02_FULL_44_20 TaxID=1797516 RepID=A0A1G1V8I3_9BACT|nr:MAG: hypothetical protein A2700_01160 [Candidatus Blackburnbacteria bacterium RIFCSPHIGHO2_01_FULL_44_64]OGY11587.1 MAG: hypothetical protein A3E16_04545 [Candidatus Blackburnbacteria bacterium RIFCSPHIGHO2_12_FULL_44_25]OGY11686.1 MAG: hypothetical protein A3D26_01060 [Candidatus Blackburnbacteria bacterium RIFCSPHIGHO2_02_FULL_44_20]OGY14388.1 MAG: hypothetical protein A3A62_03505 [Candidatus Blackburnbacteria bacterium RIFCSPLOWO2_01_FULL_44_43]OGY17411.1 MAG: hypothetical protein A3H88_0